MAVHACTIISRNHRAQARVLAATFRRHHPGGTFDVLVLDGDRYPLASNEPFGVLSPRDLSLDELEFRRMAAAYDAHELATALKPWLLRALLGRYDHAVYLDSDIALHGSLERVVELARTHSFVLTPHVTVPLERRTAEPVETTVLLAGIYNGGFLAANRDADDVLGWWADRLLRECVVAPREARQAD